MTLKVVVYLGTLVVLAVMGLVAVVMLFQRTMENPCLSACAGLGVAWMIVLNILMGRRKSSSSNSAITVPPAGD